MSGLIRFGALWKGREGGKAVMSGTVNRDTRVIILPNTRKEAPNQPDFHLFLAENEKKEDGSAGAPPSGGGEDDEPLPF